MNDRDLLDLASSAAQESADPLENPPQSSLQYLAGLGLTDYDLVLLLGDAPGMSPADVTTETKAFLPNFGVALGRSCATMLD